MNRKLGKRVPIRRRVLVIVLQTMIISLLAASITGYFCLRWIEKTSEEALTKQIESDLKIIVEQKAASADARLEHYEKYIEFVTDYIGDMYADEEEMVKRGRIFYAPQDTKEYALTRVFASEDMDPADFKDQILFFSNLEQIWRPIAKANEQLITTVYAGTKDGLLTSYDRWSYLSVPPDGKELIYDYFQSEWYKKGLKEDGVFYTGLYVDSQGRGLTITVASPFCNTDGEVMGVCCADFDITGLYDELLSMDLDEGTFSFALDQEGTVISPETDDPSVKEYTGLSDEDIDALRSDPDGIIQRNDAVYVCIPIERVGWTLCVSVPMKAIRDTIQEADRSILYATITFMVIILIIIMLSVYAVNKFASSIIDPMEQLGRDMKVISDGDLNYRAAVYRNDEIGDITSQMNEMVDRLNFTMKELYSSQQYANAMSVLATKDALTGVQNKTAFDEKMNTLKSEFDAGDKDFGLVMADLNNLKMINDSYGHDKGDISIRKVSAMICEVFEHSPVYRVGGDEFMVVLKGRDYLNAADLTGQFRSRIQSVSSESSLKPWERISAAIGYALYDETVDKSVEDVRIRADREMYRNKKDMKSVQDI